jgi:hypothetical protein
VPIPSLTLRFEVFLRFFLLNFFPFLRPYPPLGKKSCRK